MLLVAAVIVGIIGGVALITYMKPQKTTVYTFKDNYKAGTEVTSDMLTAVQCDSKIVTAGKKTDTSSRFVTGANFMAVLNSGDGCGRRNAFDIINAVSERGIYSGNEYGSDQSSSYSASYKCKWCVK